MDMSSEKKYQIKVFLENLRRSGQTNMFEASPYLEKEFGLNLCEATKELGEWMATYDPNDYYRNCEKCGKAMSDGFIIGDGDAYYCSEECMYQDYTEEEVRKMYEADEAYYTEWDE